MTRFLGDSPLRVLFKLMLLSLVVGWALNWLEITPWQLYERSANLAREVWHTGLAGLGDFGGTVAIGAMIVVPLFLLSRLLNYRGRA